MAVERVVSDNDQKALAMVADTIRRDPNGSRCLYCDHVRLWNVDPCIHCAESARRRALRLWLVVLFVVGLSVVAAVVVEPIPGPRVADDHNRD